MIITLLGKGFKTAEDKRAIYSFDKLLAKKFNLKKRNYTNMLPLLIDNFENKKIIPIFTKEAKETQQVVLKDEFDNKYDELFKDEYFLEDTKDFSSILKVLNSVINQENSYIIDLTHSFRHLPILATISLISNHITDTSRVEHIFFAKEIIPSTRDTIGEYEIIDLKEYLELANLSFMLSTFNQNYTLASNIKFTNILYERISKELSTFSNHFLANSFKPLIEGKTVENIIDNLEELQKKETINNFENYITEIIEHLEDIRQLKYERSDWKRLYKLSREMDKRGYQLNAITLLFEALGFYCLESLSQLNSIKKRAEEFKTFIEKKKKPLHIYSTYTMVNDARVIVKKRIKFKIINEKQQFINKQKYIDDINAFLDTIDNIKEFKKFIESLEGLRNNLAHGNSGFSLNDVKETYNKNLEKFEKFIIKNDILRKKNSIEILSKKWH